MEARSDNLLRPASLRAPATRQALAVAMASAVFSPALQAEEVATPLAAPAVTETALPVAGTTDAGVATEAAPAVTLDALEVEERTLDTNPYAQAGAPYKARVSGDARHVKPLADTPQTISVLTQEQIRDSGRTDLREVLAAQPGITLGTGENGNAFGDRYVIRGYEARSDVFVDGLRDPGMTIRESFASEQVEISKGPSATFAGRGTVGGAINSISKQAAVDYGFTRVDIGTGTDEYRRVTLDANNPVSDTVALRINLLQAYEQVPDRAPADRARDGLALAGLFTASDRLTFKADIYHLEANDRPDLGTYIEPNGGKPVKDLPAYLQEQDFLSSEVNVGTLRVEYEASDDFRITNALRYGTTDNGYVTTGARGRTRGVNDPFAGLATVTLSSHQGWQEVENLVDQLNFYWDTDLLQKRHQFIFGLEYSDVKVLNGIYTNLANTANYNCYIDGNTPATAANNFCIVDGSGQYINNIDRLMGRSISRGTWDSDYQVETISVSVMDTVEITDAWDLFAGVRGDAFDYSNRVKNTNTLVETLYAYDDILWNFHLGTVHEIAEDGNVYLTYSTASEINGGESDLGANCGYGGVCTVNGDPDLVGKSKPEDTRNIELGTKWEFAEERLLLTAALFEVTKNHVMEGLSAASYATTGTLNTGSNRVRGIEVGLTGNVTDTLSTQFGVTSMKSEVLKSVLDPNSEGRTLSNFADHQLFLQLRWQATPALAVGGVTTYASERYAGQPDSAAAWNTTTGDYSYEIPEYTVLDLFAEYEISRKFDLRLNVNNVADADYYLAAYRSGAFTYIGDGRNANLTLSWEF